MNIKKIKKGFTLLEILLVIVVIGILAAIVLVAINPNRQISQARNASRSSDVGTIYKALNQYLIYSGKFPTAIDNMQEGYSSRREICRSGITSTNSSCINITSEIVPTYIADMPVDPSRRDNNSTKYSVIKNCNNTVSIRAEDAELEKEIIAGVVLSDSSCSNSIGNITNLVAQVTGSNNNDVKLTWTAPSSPSPITEYKVIYSTDTDFSNPNIINGVTSIEYTLSNLSIGLYKFKVIPVNADGQGPDSNIAKAVVCGVSGSVCEDHNGNDWIINNNQVIEGVHYNIGNFIVNSGVTAGCNVGKSLVVYANQYKGLGTIDFTGCGYRGGRDGHSGDNGLGPGGGGSQYGGGYGGAGAGPGGGIAYGSIDQPVELGSGGGKEVFAGPVGGRGGGAIKIVTSGDIDIAGSILANGANGGLNWSYGSYGGGGAGGSIWLDAGGQFKGAGIIRTNGGGPVNGGAGGRIAIYYGNSIFSGTITSNGGGGSQIGGAGTIWQNNKISGGKLLAINNGNLGNINNPITKIEESSFNGNTLQNLTITGKANVVLDKSLTIGNTSFVLGVDSRLTQNQSISSSNMTTFNISGGAIWQQNAEMSGSSLSSMNIEGTWIRDITQVFNQGLATLTVSNGGLITHSLNPAISTKQVGIDMQLASLTVQSGGNIDVSGKGYRGGRDGHSGDNGLGTGGATGIQDGGGYGGRGGGPGGGIAYGSIDQPVELGSGGGKEVFAGVVGGRGGGAIKIVTSGDIDIAGSILANGANGGLNSTYGSYGGGGAGGSIWLDAGGQFKGAGIIRTNGGGSSNGGAGGRIAIYYGNSIFSGTITSNGGGGGYGQIGGAGTIKQQQK